MNMISVTMLYSWLVLVGRLPDVFPVGAMIAGPFFSLLGGGDCVGLATVAAIISDISQDQAQR